MWQNPTTHKSEIHDSARFPSLREGAARSLSRPPRVPAGACLGWAGGVCPEEGATPRAGGDKVWSGALENPQETERSMLGVGRGLPAHFFEHRDMLHTSFGKRDLSSAKAAPRVSDPGCRTHSYGTF